MFPIGTKIRFQIPSPRHEMRLNEYGCFRLDESNGIEAVAFEYRGIVK